MPEDNKESLEDVFERYHLAVDRFSRGDPEPVKALFSHRDDVTLANPFGPAVRGWEKVSDALSFASSRFSEGEAANFERLASYAVADLATVLEVEGWRAKVGERRDVAAFELRVTSTFRREEGKLVHRHADPISEPDPDGPLRS